MNTIYTDDSSVARLGSLDFGHVQALANWCDRSLSDPNSAINVAERKSIDARWKANRIKNERQRKLENDRAPRVEAWLRKNLETGMVLHVKGAKDGRGMREFIDWDGDLLLCWQLNQDGNRTTCVTTHMPDKVIWVRGSESNQLRRMCDL